MRSDKATLWKKQTADWVHVWIDGCCEPNPGAAGIGAYFKDAHGKELECLFEPLEWATSNEAEYSALLMALEMAIRRQWKFLCVYTDSSLLRNQISGNSPVFANNLRVLYQRVMRLRRQLSGARICWVPREENQMADALSRLARGMHDLFLWDGCDTRNVGITHEIPDEEAPLSLRDEYDSEKTRYFERVYSKRGLRSGDTFRGVRQRFIE